MLQNPPSGILSRISLYSWLSRVALQEGMENAPVPPSGIWSRILPGLEKTCFRGNRLFLGVFAFWVL